MKKIICLLSICTMVLLASVVVSADSKNEKVDWLNVNGIDYNSTYSTGHVQGVVYDASINTLTIENCNVEVFEENEDFISYAGDIPLKVLIKGKNTIIGKNGGDFIRAFIANDMSADNSIRISGGGSVVLKEFEGIIDIGILENEKNGTISIEDVSIDTDGAGFYSFYGDLSIKKSTIILNNSNRKAIREAIHMGTSEQDPNGNGTINIQDSIVELINYTGSELICCKKMNLVEEYIYAGKDSLKNQYTFDTLCPYQKDSYEGLRYSRDDINYVLITNEKKNYPMYSTKDNGTTKEVAPKSQTNKLAKVILSKVKNVKGKKVKLIWNKVKGVNGYEIQYALNRKFTKNKKSIFSTGVKKTTKKLKKKKTYYFRIRAYKNTKNGKVYGSWSTVKKVKIKK